MADALSLKGVTAGYGETHVLEGIDLSLSEGESLSIIGRNGVGKSTLLETVMGHTTLHAGAISFRGRRIEAVPAHARALAGLGYVPQEREIFPSLSVVENLQICARPGPWDAARVYELFPHLKGRLANAGTQLSGGEQQMLAIALGLNPRVLLLDEPAAGIPSAESHILLDAIATLPKDIAVLIIEHDMDLVFRFAERITVLVSGAILAEGAPAEIAANRDVRAVYLGNAA